MMKPLFVRPLTKKEEQTLQTQLQSNSAFTVRRCQILLSSAQKKKASQIAAELHCSDQCVRVAIHAFHHEGLACLQEKSHARHDDQRPFDEAGLNRLKKMVRLSPRQFGHETSVWTLELLAESCWTEKISRRPVSADSVSRALQRLGLNWRRVKQWGHSPDPHYQHKKKDAIASSSMAKLNPTG